jgi:hypothetical protein
MSEFIGKLRRSWRSYLLWGIFWALLMVPLTLSMIFASISWEEANKKANQKYVPELRKIAEHTPLYPGFQKTSEYVVLKRGSVSFFTTYNSDAQFADVKKF